MAHPTTFRDFIKEFDPFKEPADTQHIGIFETAGVEFHLPSWISKFMILELIAASIILLVFVPAARRIARGGVVKGRLTHAVEALLLFIRDQVAIPTLGEHDSKRFLPFLWTIFVFVLVVNLLGMIPFLGSATASIAVTGVLALIAFLTIHYHGIKSAHGFGHYLDTFKVKIDRDSPLLKILAPIIELGIFFLEVLGAFIRGIVLAVRLFANMLAGHTALFVILSFIPMIGIAVHEGTADGYWYFIITPLSVLTIIGLSLLEMFVACVQAFVFVFLTSTFLGMALHPEH
ncbi:F0F1 ATP synthase subunit A [Zavarzinella formosa]|uniref:F0F1 ATP synthase subunit A n=1 Tax=Zavarzinella formosa TaxID=360055 RepID=UPI0002EB421A|nr:F0F1 ATP synthase subunit A [Zavarzinella formosa]